MIEFQYFNVLCWNIRGAINVDGRRHIKELVRKHTPAIVILMETHCIFKKVSKFWERVGYDISGYSEAQGHASGIWVLVEKNDNFSISVIDIFHQVVTVSIKRDIRSWA